MGGKPQFSLSKHVQIGRKFCFKNNQQNTVIYSWSKNIIFSYNLQLER